MHSRHIPSMPSSLDRSSSHTPRSSSFSPTYGKPYLSDISTLSSSSSFSSSSSLFGSIKRNGSSGPLKPSTKSYASILIPSVAVGKKKLSISEPASPHVTCLGRIRIKEPGTFASSKDLHKSEDCVAQSQPRERRIKTKDAKKTSEEVGCFSGRMRRSSAKDALILDQSQIVLRRFSSSVNVETRRDRGRPFTSFLENSKPRLQNEAMDMQQEYIPAVPPPNSLLLMRDMKRKENLDSAGDHLHQRMHLRTTSSMSAAEGNNKKITRNPSSSSKREAASSSRSRETKPIATSKGSSISTTSRSEGDQIFAVDEELSGRKDVVPRPLSERENNTIMIQEKCRENCRAPLTDYVPSGLALWQRRAIAELSAIDVSRSTDIKGGGIRGMHHQIPLIRSS